MRARPLFVSAGLLAALLPSSASAAGVTLSASTGQQLDVLHNTIASFSAEGSSIVEQVSWQGDGAGATLWVLAVAPGAEIVLSSDALVSTFDQSLQVVVRQPANSCFMPQFDDCGGSVGGGVGGGQGTLFPVADPVVWPTSTSSLAGVADLDAWLAGAGVTPSVGMVGAFEAAEAAGYGFLLMEFPAQSGLSTSPAVRITSSEPSEVVPMLSPRTDSEVKLTLIGDRRYAPVSLPASEIEEKDLEWSWTTMESNYYPLAGEAIAAGWLTEAGEPLSPYAFDKLIALAANDPYNSGYDVAEVDPYSAATADADALRLGLSSGSTWISRVTTRVPASGFELELALAPVDSLSVVDRDLTPSVETGTIPSCEDNGGCGDAFLDEDMMGDDTGELGCSAARRASASPSWLALAVAALALGARKRLIER